MSVDITHIDNSEMNTASSNKRPLKKEDFKGLERVMTINEFKEALNQDNYDDNIFNRSKLIKELELENYFIEQLPTFKVSTPYSDEGIDLNDVTISRRLETVKSLFRDMETRPVLLVRAPPYCGKTSLAKLVWSFATKQKQGVIVDSLSMLGIMDDQQFYELWNQKIGPNWRNSWKSPTPRIILIDEAQKIYKMVKKFWEECKLLQQEKDSTCRIVFFSVYGDSDRNSNIATPIVIPSPSNILGNIEFTQSEFEEYMNNYNNSSMGKEVPITDDIKKYIDNFVGRHVGLTRKTIELISQKFRDNGSPKLMDVVTYTLSKDFMIAISLTRAVPDITLNADQKNFITHLLGMPDYRLSLEFTVKEGMKPAYESLMKSFYFAIFNNNEIGFASPMVRFIITSRLLKSEVRYSSVTSKSTDLQEFVVLVLRRFRPNILRNALTLGTDDKLLERIWQMEFYTHATSILPPTNSISPDFNGKDLVENRSKGYADFYVNGDLKWLIEITREGCNIGEHLSRFSDGGIYDRMAKGVKNWAVIDFRSVSKKPIYDHDRLMTVSYTNDYKTLHFKSKTFSNHIYLQD